MKQVIVAAAAEKGGVGKTTMAMCLASLYAHTGSRTLVIDVDPQSNVAFGFGKPPDAPGTAEFLMGQRPQHIEVAENLRILPGGPTLNDRKIQSLEPEALLDAIAGLEYDAIFFDCPAGNQHLQRMALVAATTALAVADAHKYALQGARQIINAVKDRKQKGRPGCSKWAVIQNRIDIRRGLDRDFDNAVDQTLSEITRFQVKQDAQIALSSMYGVPIMQFAPTTPAVAELRLIKEWIDE